jgi:hypothetical protein
MFRMAINNYLEPLQSNYLELFPTWNDGNISKYQIPLRNEKMAKIEDMRELTSTLIEMTKWSRSPCVIIAYHVASNYVQ